MSVSQAIGCAFLYKLPMLQDKLVRLKEERTLLSTVPVNSHSPALGNSDSSLPVLHPLTLKSIQLNFYKELEDSMAGKKTSLPFILHSISTQPLVSENETFQVMVIGGSVFKQAIAKKRKNGVTFLDKSQEKLPVFHTKNDFITLVEQHLDPTARVVALNFAYPLGPVFDEGKLDGVLLSGTKEHSFKGLVGERVGQSLERYFLKKYKRKIDFAVANDTVCLLLSGLRKASWNKLACGIVGTGVNFAFFLDATDLVNLESANFNKFPASRETKGIDLRSTHTGQGLFEKETAGGYLYQHFNSIVAKQKLPHPPLTSTWELKKLALRDTTWITPIARGLIKKSAALIAAQIAGITLYKRRDMTFVMEGSFFWDEDIYREYVEHYLRILIPERKITFVSVPDSPFLGAAKLVA